MALLTPDEEEGMLTALGGVPITFGALSPVGLVSTFDEVAMAGDMAGVAPLVLGRVIEVQFVTDRVPNLDIGSTIAWGGATYTVRDLRRIDEGGATVVRCERA